MCVTPFIKKHSKDGETVLYSPLPCGKCAKCRKAKLNAWLFRFEQELKISTHPLFITLTYREEELLYSDDGATLYKKDLQDFMKKLRHKCKNKLVYYAVGEYGKRRKRPHYHMILLNFDVKDFWQVIHDTWGKGRIDAQNIDNMKSIAYTLKYISKPKNPKDSRQPEFSLMSKGIGSNYLTDRMKKWHTSTPEHCYVRKNDGSKLSIPKYYKEKIYDENMREQVTSYNSKRAKEAENKEITNYLEKFPQFSWNEAKEFIRLNHAKETKSRSVEKF